MPDTSDTDHSTLSVRDENDREQLPLEPLPWEVGKGFLWGLPKTAWLVLIYPWKAFAAPQASGTYRVFLFSFLVVLIVYLSKFLFTSIIAYSQFAHLSLYETITKPLAMFQEFSIATYLKMIMTLSFYVCIKCFFNMSALGLTLWSFVCIFKSNEGGLVSRFNSETFLAYQANEFFRIASYASAASVFSAWNFGMLIAGGVFEIYLISVAIVIIYDLSLEKAILASILSKITGGMVSQQMMDYFNSLLKLTPS
ncbi:MAG: hypothetical protein HY910_17640 [Desulfarculus sp.]|nr:hypothetical protein [Desulfarculus sp.]